VTASRDDRRRVAVLGGTFDPIHLGHLALAEQAQKHLAADEVWLVPARQPAHRTPAQASAEDRVDMVAAAVAGDPAMRVLDLEARRPGPSYTFDTVVELNRLHPDVELWLVLGADAAREIASWHRRAELMEQAHFLLTNRTGVEELTEAEVRKLGFPEERTRLVHIASPPIHATQVRERIQAGEALDGLVPEPVAWLIAERGLYRPSVG
jgi:nicotinate-nucleotide adenylyltransferase